MNRFMQKMGKLELEVISPTPSKSPSLLQPLYSFPVDAMELEQTETPKSSNRTTCDFCLRFFKSHIGLYNHEKKHKRERKKQRQLKAIKENRRILRVFTCIECDCEFNQKRMLTLHRKTHAELFKCTFCHKQFKDRMDLEWHGAINDGLQYDSLNTPIHRTRSRSRISCRVDRAKSLDLNLFRESYADVDTYRSKSSLSGANFKRNEINYWINNNQYYSASDFDEVKSVSYRPLTSSAMSFTSINSFGSTFRNLNCSVINCMKTFPNLQWLTVHEINEHKRLALYRCKECRHRFTHQVGLRQHMLENHPVAITCLLCDQPLRSVFDYAEHYELHQKLIHECNLCGKMFLTEYLLEEHMRNKRFHKGTLSSHPKAKIEFRYDVQSFPDLIEVDLEEKYILNGYFDVKYTTEVLCTYEHQFTAGFSFESDSSPWRVFVN